MATSCEGKSEPLRQFRPSDRDDQLTQPTVKGSIMTSAIVNLMVTVNIPIDCDFWSEDDGWKGVCKSLSFTVRGSSFEDAKKNMAGELQVYIEGILREHSKGSTRRIA